MEFSERIEGDGADIFKAACKLGHEGIVAKRKDLPYESGRSKRWLKIKNTRRPRGGSRKERSRQTAGNGRLAKWSARNSRSATASGCVRSTARTQKRLSDAGIL